MEAQKSTETGLYINMNLLDLAGKTGEIMLGMKSEDQDDGFQSAQPRPDQIPPVA